MIWKTIPFQVKLVSRASKIAVRNISISNPQRKTYYEALGLPNDASQADVKKAYFELSKKYHPDRIEATDDNLAKFREISAAYEVLSNEQSRKLYDRGFLGDMSKPIEESKEVVDPIVKFYKQRQDLTKELLKPIEESKTTTRRIIRQSDLLKKAEYIKVNSEFGSQNILLKDACLKFVPLIILLLYVLANFKDSVVRRKWLKIKSYF